jgi:membrane-bound lytic murein transglycosylase D
MNLSLNSLSLVICLLSLSACSTLKKGGGSVDARGSESLAVHGAEIESFRASEPELPEMTVAEFDQIPEDVQPHVQKWLNYFQGKGREHMERYLSRSTRYERLMKRILRENGIPEDLIYIALIESGFSPRAISRSRAVGYWQFIRGTGKRYGLAINTFVDERRDPVLATQAAADYFKGLYSEFNSWFLSMASYNVGEGRVRRELNRTKSHDFWTLAKRRRLPKETINYVPKFLAARLIARKPEAYGFTDIPFEPPIEFETVRFEQSVNMKILADKLNVDYAELKRLNPKYRGEVAPIAGNNLELRLPLNMKDSALALANQVTVKDLVFVPDRGETDVYKVRGGDTLLKIARRFKTSVAFLREINDFKRRSRLRPGRTIFVPVPATAMPKATVDTVLVAKNSGGTDSAAKGTSKPADEALYLVQESESLAEIAIRNNMTMEELMELNSFTEGQVIAVGMQLKVKKIQPEAGEPSVEDLPSSTDAVVVKNAIETKLDTSAELNTRSEISSANSSIPVGIDEEAKRELLHKVRPGETLFRIAQQYNTTVSALKKANNLRRRKVLRAGAILKIPTAADRKTSDSTRSPSRIPVFPAT